MEIEKGIFLAMLAILQQKAAKDSSFGNSWAGYTAILCYVHEMPQRIPSLEAIEAYDEDAIDHLFEAELEHLAHAVTTIFPGRGVEELSYYVHNGNE